MSKKPRNWQRLPQLAEHLNTSRSWIYKRTMNGEIPHHRVGGLLLFDLAEIEAWIRMQPRCRVKRNGERR